MPSNRCLFPVLFVVFIACLTGGIVMLIFGVEMDSLYTQTPSSAPANPSRPSQVFVAVTCTVYNGFVAEVSDGESSWYQVEYNASFPYDSEITVWGWLSNDTESFQTEGKASDVLASRPTLPPLICYYDPNQLDFERNSNPIWAENPQKAKPGDPDGSSPISLTAFRSGALALIIIGSILVAAAAGTIVTIVLLIFKRAVTNQSAASKSSSTISNMKEQELS